MHENLALLIDYSTSFSQYAFNLLLQSTVLIIAGLTIGRVSRRHGSAVQSAIYRATLVTVLVCPLAAIGVKQLGFQGWTVQLPATQNSVTSEVTQPRTEAIQSVKLQPAATNGQGDTQSVDQRFSNLPTQLESALDEPEFPTEFQLPPMSNPRDSTSNPEPIFETTTVNSPAVITAYVLVTTFWLFGTLLLVSRVILAYRKLGVLRKQSSLANETERQVCHTMAKRISVPSPEVWRNSLLSSPCLTGVAKPAILLPSEIHERVLLEKAFAHELGHLRRRDTLWNLIQRIALSLFFFQPLLWRLVYQLETTAEEVCDDYVVRYCQDRTGYAQQLVELAESNLVAPNMAGLGMFKTNRSMLGQRVIRILDSTRTLTTQISSPIVVTIISLAMVCAALGGFIGNGNPPAAVSTANDVESEPENPSSHIQITGRVLDPQKRPAAGSIVYVMDKKWESGYGWKQTILGQTTTQPDGRYKLSIQSPVLQATDQVSARAENIFIAAFQNGSAPDWKVIALSADRSSIECELKLATTKPYSWQLVDIDGQPLAGATIRVGSIGGTQSEQLELNNSPHQIVVRSDKSGRFTIDSLGFKNSANVFISGDSIATRTALLVLLTTEEYEALGNGMWESNGQNFAGDQLIACSPGMDVRGVVRDSKTGQPIEGATVISGRVFNYDLKTVSDADGKYQITGVPITNQLWMRCDPPATLPYLKQDFSKQVPTETSHTIDIALNRGIWIEGIVKDLDSGKPVPNAVVYHFPLEDNPNLDDYPEYDGQRKGPLFNKHYFTDENGHYRLVGIPGPAVMGVRADGALGMDSNKPAAKRKLAMMYGTKIEDWLNRLKDVDFSFGATGNNVNFEIVRGKSIDLETIDANGDPISGVYVTRLNVPETNSFGVLMNNARFSATNFVPGKSRLSKFVSLDRNLGIIQEIGLPSQTDRDKKSPGEPLRVQLQPLATVKFRLVNDQGEPVSGKTLFEFDSGHQSLGVQVTQVAANGELIIPDEGVEGNYTYRDVIGGTHYVLRFQPSDSAFPVFLHTDLAVSPGEVIDLGTINVDADKIPGTFNIDADKRPKPKRSFVNTFPDSKQDSANPSQQETVVFTGRVVDLNGVAVPNAEVSRSETKTLTDANGQFSIEIPDTELERFTDGRPYVSIRKPGFGYSLAKLDTHGKPLTLVNDDHPIEGQLVDTEGLPIAGARIQLERFTLFSNGVLNTALEKASQLAEPLRGLPSGVRSGDEQIEAVTSDAAGRFKIRGIGSGRLAYLSITGENIAIRKAIVATTDLPGVNYQDPQANFLSDGIIHNRHPVLTCEPCQPMEGIVIDRDTRRPLAGFGVTSYGFLNEGNSHLVGQTDLKTTTDDQGRFRLTGMPKGSGNSIIVTAPTSGEFAQPYITQIVDVADAPGISPVQMKVALQRGVWISGTLSDAETGRPIAGAGMQYLPLDDNEAAQQLNRSQQELLGSDYYGPRTDELGNFRFVGIPGPAIIGPWVLQDANYPADTQKTAVPTSQLVDGRIASRYFRTPSPFTNTYKRIEVADGGLVGLELSANKGKSVRIKTVDAQGNPVDSVNVSYLPALVQNNLKTKTAEFDIDGFLPHSKRTVVLLNNDKRIGAVITIDANVQSPYVVTLRPLATVTAKLVDDNGDPIAGMALRFNLVSSNGNRFGGIQSGVIGRAASDKQGTFSQSMIAGDYVYSIPSFNGYSGERRIELAAGESLDLGTIVATQKIAEPMIMDQPSTQPPLPPKDDKKGPTTSKTDNSDPTLNDTGIQTFRGTIVDDNDRPIAGADGNLQLRMPLSDSRGTAELDPSQTDWC